MTSAERLQGVWAQASLFALFNLPIVVAGFFSPSPSLSSRISRIALTVLCLGCPAYYQWKYGFRFRPKWKWQWANYGKPDYAYAEWLPWFARIIGVMSIVTGLWFCSFPLLLFVSITRGPLPLLFTCVWLGGFLIAGGLFFVMSRSGFYVFQESRMVTAWWGLGGPMFRKDFCFDEFTDTSVHLVVPKEWMVRRHWRVWLREPSNAIWIRARDAEDARATAIQLAEIVEVRYWPPPEEATCPGSPSTADQ